MTQRLRTGRNRRRGLAAIAVTGALLVGGCGGAGAPSRPVGNGGPQVGQGQADATPLQDVTLTAAQRASLVHDDDEFAGSLTRAVTDGNTGNLVVSPESLAIVLQMLTDGARGATRQQLLGALHASGLSSRQLTAASAELFKSLSALGKQVSVSDGVWVQNGDAVTPQFAADMKSGFDGALRSVDFSDPAAAAQQINQAISAETHGHIPDLFTPDVLQGAITVLTNAIYLHADWEQPFDESMTRPASFQPASGSAEQVPTMHQTAQFSYSDSNGAQIVTLPYAGGRLGMSIVLPAQGSSPATIEAAAAKSGWDAVLSGGSLRPVELSLPRFELRTSTDLVAALRALGVTDAFGSGADLSGICSQCQVTAVQQQAWLKTDERGTTAAAATGVVMGATAVRADPPQTVVMNVDRPFVAVIRDLQTGLPLFVAQVEDPSQA